MQALALAASDSAGGGVLQLWLPAHVFRPASVGEFTTPGAPIPGEVRLSLHKPLRVRGVHVVLKGKTWAIWSEGSGQNSRSYSESHELFAPVALTLAGQPKGVPGPDTTLPPGEHVWPFLLALPDPNAPTTVECGGGGVGYKIKAHADIPWAFDPKVSAPVHVASPARPAALMGSPAVGLPPAATAAAAVAAGGGLPPVAAGGVFPLPSFACCGDGGAARLALRVEHPEVVAGPPKLVTLLAGAAAATDRSSVRRLELYLKVRVTLRAEGNTETRTERVSETLVIEAPHEGSLAVLPKGSRLPDDLPLVAHALSARLEGVYSVHSRCVSREVLAVLRLRVPWAGGTTSVHVPLWVWPRDPASFAAAPPQLMMVVAPGGAGAMPGAPLPQFMGAPQLMAAGAAAAAGGGGGAPAYYGAAAAPAYGQAAYPPHAQGHAHAGAYPPSAPDGAAHEGAPATVKEV